MSVGGRGFFGLPPGTHYPVLVVRERRWWQLWKPRRWTEWEDRVVPPPDHPNCRCTVRPTYWGRDLVDNPLPARRP